MFYRKPAVHRRHVAEPIGIRLKHLLLIAMLIAASIGSAVGQSTNTTDTLFIFRECNGTGLQLIPSTTVRVLGLSHDNIVGTASQIEEVGGIVSLIDDKGRRYFVSKENVHFTCQ